MSNFLSGSGQKTCSPTVNPRTEMPESMSHFSYEEILQACNAHNESQVAHQLNHLDWVLDNSAALSQWEIDLANKVLQKFAAKYNSPLSQETK